MTSGAEPTASSLSVENVSRWYGNVVAVNDISFSLSAGITGLLGPNGAGKSTLLHMLAGILQPSSGDAKIGAESAWENPDIYRLVGFVPEREAVYPFLTGLDFVKLSARLHGLADPEGASIKAIEAVEMQDTMKRPTGGYS
jgi:ABC-2 type transport system ATP-binding protein